VQSDFDKRGAALFIIHSRRRWSAEMRIAMGPSQAESPAIERPWDPALICSSALRESGDHGRILHFFQSARAHHADVS
jgi:hypothetical protein